MARPKKAEKRDKRLTVYLTNAEESALNIVAEMLPIDKAKFAVSAIIEKIKRLTSPPPTIAHAQAEEIMQATKEMVTGYVCRNGHAFWLQWTWPTLPERCPACGSRDIKHTWAGVVRRGFE